MAKKDYTNWDRNDLIKEIEQLRKRKKYGLVWEDNTENVVEQCKTQLPVLKEVQNKEIMTDSEKPVNLLIEGDNYHALSVLNYTHKGKIDVIYIDPPYNTGAKDFIFNDKFVDKDDSFRHSKWLSFMEKKLKLAKNLLKSNGAIFISIDDHEQASLRLLCDEIFGESNFYGCLTWIKRTKSTNSGKAKKMLQQKAEYILVYGKDNTEKFAGFKLLYNGIKKNYPHSGKFGKCRFENLEATDYGRKKRDTMKFKILGIAPRTGRRWQIGKDTADKLVSECKIELVDGFPMRAVYSEDEEGESFIPFWSHLEETGTAETGKVELSDVVGPDHGFDTVKPIPLIKILLKRFENNATILDFFAGSGTTGQAVLELNREDGGNRKFILCTNNENNIAIDITYPRIKNIIKGYKFSGTDKNILFEKPLTYKALQTIDVDLKEIEKIRESQIKIFDTFEVKIAYNTLALYGIKKSNGKKNGLGGNLKYFKTSFVPSEPTDKNKSNLTQKVTEMLCIKENTFDEVKSTNKYKIFRSKERYTGIVFDHQAIDELKKEIAKIEGKFSLYIFSLGDDNFEEEFEDMKTKVKLSPIPEAILRVYRRIFK